MLPAFVVAVAAAFGAVAVAITVATAAAAAFALLSLLPPLLSALFLKAARALIVAAASAPLP